MGMQILHRKYAFDNPFRRALCQLMSLEGDTLILSTGFATDSIFNSYNRTDFIDSIKNGFVNTKNPQVIAIGGMLRNQSSRNEFEAFLNEFSKALTAYNYTLKFYRANNDKWHSKVALKLKNGRPFAGIIGSSNLTGPAFSVYTNNTNYSTYFNYESDIYIWNNYMLKGFKGIRNKKYTKEELNEEREKVINDLYGILSDDFKYEVNWDTLKDWACIDIDKLERYTIMKLSLNSEDSLILSFIYEIKKYNNILNSMNSDEDNIEIESVFDMKSSKRAYLKILNDLYEEIKYSLNHLNFSCAQKVNGKYKL